MTGSAPITPDLPGLRMLLGASEKLGDAQGAVLQLCIVTLCLPWEAIEIQIDRIDWRRGGVVVPARGVRGRTRRLALSSAALQIVLQIAGSASRTGQAVTGGRGPELRKRDVRLGRLRGRLGDVDPAALDLDWNFHGLRRAGAEALRDDGVSDGDIAAMLGFVAEDKARSFADPVERAIRAAERWSRMLIHERGGLHPAPE